MVHEGKPYCQEDYLKICGKKCSGCGEYISGEYINALDQEWHKKCFNCFVSEKNIRKKIHKVMKKFYQDCKRPFTNGTFLVKDNKPFCEEHYHNPTKQAYQTPLKRPQQSSRPSQEHRAPPPAIKPKPVISRKPDFSTKPEPEVKRPEINNYRSSSSSKKTEPTIINKKLDFSTKPEPELKRPEINNYRSSNSSIKSESTVNNIASANTGSKVCHQCNEAIDGPCASALGHDYHIHHFQCFYCSRALSSRVPGMWQGDKNGELTCKMCAFKQNEL